MLKHLPRAQAARRQVKIVFLPVSPHRPTGPLVRSLRTGSLSARQSTNPFPEAVPGWLRALTRSGRFHPQGTSGAGRGSPGEAQPAGRGEHRHRHRERPSFGRLLPSGSTVLLFPFVRSSAPSALFCTVPREYCEPHRCYSALCLLCSSSGRAL